MIEAAVDGTLTLVTDLIVICEMVWVIDSVYQLSKKDIAERITNIEQRARSTSKFSLASIRPFLSGSLRSLKATGRATAGAIEISLEAPAMAYPPFLQYQKCLTSLSQHTIFQKQNIRGG
jgi:hypothetical protein